MRKAASRKLRYVREYEDDVLNDIAVYRQSLHLGLLLFRSEPSAQTSTQSNQTYRSRELQDRFTGNVSFFGIILDIEVDDMYWAIVISASCQ
jgi:hypothetical protein